MSATGKRKAKPKAAKKAAAKPRVVKKRVPQARKPVERVEAPAQVAPARPPKKEVPAEKSFLLALRLKGSFGTPATLERALSTLRLENRFNAVLLENKANVIGMLRGVKDYVTWGEIKTAEIAKLLKNRGELEGGSSITDDSVKKTFGEDSVNSLAEGLTRGRITLNALWTKGLRPVFRLRPPSGGFATSTKRPHGNRGELGGRGTELPKLLDRML